MAVPWLIADARFPHFRNNVDPDETWGDGLKENGHAVPGIIDVGDLLGTSAFEVVSLSEPELRAHPITGADAIVTILYQHRPSLLRQFLDASDFTYVHSFDKHLFEANPVPRMHFVISRRGDDLKAGFYDGHTPGQTPDDWWSTVRYTIIDQAEWRQEEVQCPGRCFDDGSKGMVCSGETDCRPSRKYFELWAGWALVPAIKQRRWSAQPGAYIEINTKREKLGED